MNTFEHELDGNHLIAYHLRELSARQQRSVRRLLEQNAALAAESEAIAATLRAFPRHEAALAVDAATRERTWLALLPSLAFHPPKPPLSLTLLRRWSLPLLAGSAIAATALLVSLHHERHAQLPTVATVASTHSSTVPSPSSVTGSNAALSSGLSSTAPTPGPWITNREWRRSPAPTRSEGSRPSDHPQMSLNVLPPQRGAPQGTTQSSPAESSPANASAAPASVAPGEGTSLLSSSNPPTASSAQPNTIRQPFRVRGPHPVDVTLGIFGSLADTHSSESAILQGETKTVGALASFHQQLRPWLGYRITSTYSEPTFAYLNAIPSTVPQRVYELSGTYAVQGPRHGRFTTSAEAGAGLLSFHTIDPYELSWITIHPVRVAAIAGVASEFALDKHWALRAEYRVQLYKPPGFYTANDLGSGFPAPAGTNFTFNSNPIFGITYRFGGEGGN